MSYKGLTFQDAIARLEAYWGDQGCAVWLPHNVEVGAGTMNPATFLHVLGPEPWNVAYVEPGIRPDDARYGENPNRMGRHHQFQVILKPDPGDPQDLYLESLAALGIDLLRHDVRFVEDNWESPALGAWGLGWEVWLDGLEISQFTYFQQAGSVNLDPVSVELTYGVDRILMALQDVTHFRDLRWNEYLTFGDVLLAYEIQTSKYYFEEADIGRLTQMYDACEAEAVMSLDKGLTRPAHDYVLRCSHIFNVLDARGAVGVTERARFFARMRRLARGVAEGFLAERETLGYPLLDERGLGPWVAGTLGGTSDGIASDPEDSSGPHEAPPREAVSAPEQPASFLLEVGVEELPVADLDTAVAALGTRLEEALADSRLEHEGLRAFGTPRRLAVLVSNLAPRQPDVERQIVGPPADKAFDDDGRPTKAGEGFARSAGVEPEELEVIERGGERRVTALKREAGRPAFEVLGEIVPGVLSGLPFERSMRWNESRQLFSRPVRWLAAMHGAKVVPIEFAGVASGSATHVMRTAQAPEKELAAAADYPKLMRSVGIAIDMDERRAEVLRQVTDRASAAGGAVPDDPALLSEVANMVEQPNAIVGEFDTEYLDLPAAVLTTVLRKHQRYFPVVGGGGGLMPLFVAVANGSGVDRDAVRHGNEGVVRARFADAAYFWKQDTARPLADFTSELDGLTFQADLGSMLDKVRRLERLAPLLARRLGLEEGDASLAERAAALSKSDLATAMVVDFTSLQGLMGREYARRSGESEEVADAIFEQYLPRGAGDQLPVTGPGIALALADRLDSLLGLFAAGVRPTGAQDPYALRRAALGVATILVERGLQLDLADALEDVAGGLPLEVGEEARTDVLDFVRRRLEGQLRDAGRAADAVRAVLAAQGNDPWAASQSVDELERHVAADGWERTLTAYARCARIVKGLDQQALQPAGALVDESLIEEPSERQLLEALRAATADLDYDDTDAVLAALAGLAPVIEQFFDDVLVMAEDEALRANRLALVGAIAALPLRVADLRHMEGF